MMVLIAFGYIYFALICCCTCCVLPILCCVAIRSNNQLDQMVDRIPYGEAIKSLSRTTFKNVQDKNDQTSCCICMEDYLETDEIAELKCDKRHFFHSKCLEEALKKKLECPICRAVIKPE